MSIPDVREAIEREIEFQRRRGMRPVGLELSPEVHDALRLLARQPAGARLLDIDGVPVRVNPRFIGLTAWRLLYAHPAPPTERQIDDARRTG